jgi:diadenylate cyclase
MDTATVVLMLKMAVEAFIIAGAIYAFIRFLQETQGSAVLKGFVVIVLFVVVGLPLVSRALDLVHLKYVADQGLPIILIGLVVIFQPELRQALVKLGDARLLQGLGPRVMGRRDTAREIVQACERCARRGLGALILIERRVRIEGFTEGGVQMQSLVSAPLLVTIFFKDTPLHDGAVIVRGRRIVAAGCVLPLSENPNLSKGLGTRHRAAVGATEENDAIAVVVSEETQRISVAIRGELRFGVTPEELHEIIAGAETEAESDVVKEGMNP